MPHTTRGKTLRNELGEILGLDHDELFGKDGNGRGYRVYRRGEPFLFGPHSKRKVQFVRGMLPRGGKLARIGALIATGLTNHGVKQTIEREYPGKEVSYLVIRKMRQVVEEERGAPFMCKCGLKLSHTGNCAYKNFTESRKKRILTADDVVSIRAIYALGIDGVSQLSKQWGVNKTTIHGIVTNRLWRPVTLRLAKYKLRSMDISLSKTRRNIQRLIDGRKLQPRPLGGGDVEDTYDDGLTQLLALLDNTLGTIARIQALK